MPLFYFYCWSLAFCFFNSANFCSKKVIASSAFTDELNKLDSIEDKLEFLYLNAYVGFPDSYWENFGNNKSLLQKLESQKTGGNEEEIQYIIDQLRKYQQKSQL